MTIKLATAADVTTIQHLANTIWPVAYSKIITTQQIEYMLNLFYSKAALLSQLNSGHQFILVIENDTAIGFASYSQKNNIKKSTFRLHKIYVLPNIIAKGIGSFLLDYICAICKQQNINLLELNVNKYNSAINFYKKKGFAILKEEVIDIGNGYIMDDYVMQLQLV